jgi:hypothetical protein
VTSRTATPIRSLAAGDGIGVLKVTTLDPAGWESPAWYAYRAAPGGGYAVCRLGSARLYCVRLGDSPADSSCECLGKESGRATCRHIGALLALRKQGKL